MRIIQYHRPDTRSLAPAFGLFGRSPWTGLENEFDRLFTTLGVSGADAQFPVDLSEDKENVYVRAELPGVKREELKVEVLEGVLTISASRERKEAGSDESFSLSRSVSVPEAQADKITAAYADGVLKVTLPKREAAKPVQIAVS